MRLRRRANFGDAIALWSLCGMWAAGDDQAGDTGVVPLDVIACQGITDWKSAMDALVEVGLWEVVPGDEEVIAFHDWDDWNGPGAKAKRIEKRLESDRIRQANRRERLSRVTSRDTSRDSLGRSRDGHVKDGYGYGNGVKSPRSSETDDVTTSRHVAEICRDDVERLCTHLADRVTANGSKRPRITKAWRTSARLLMDADGRTEDQVHRAIDWCQDSEFWRSNILSMPTLREKYDQIRLQASRRSPPTGEDQHPVSKTTAALADLAERARIAESNERATQIPLGDFS